MFGFQSGNKKLPRVVAIERALQEELDILVHPVLHGKMEPEHWCANMQSDRGIPVQACVQYLWSTHAIWVNEWAVTSLQWAYSQYGRH